MPPGLGFFQTSLSHLEELQRCDSPGGSEGATVEETAAYVEGSLQEGLGLNLDYMETVTQNITLRLKNIKRTNLFASEGHCHERLLEEMEELKHALFEKNSVRVCIRAHLYFLRFCTWLGHQEETGGVEELLIWERSLLRVHALVKREIEEALKVVAPEAY